MSPLLETNKGTRRKKYKKKDWILKKENRKEQKNEC